MATVGQGAYAPAVHTFIDGLVTGDLEKALSVVADDADMQSPWNEGTITGRKTIEAALTPLFEDAAARPSFSLQDIDGDGNVVKMLVTVGGRFGEAARPHRVRLLHLKGRIHHIEWKPAT